MNSIRDLPEKPCLVAEDEKSSDHDTQGYYSATESDSAQGYNSATESKSAKSSFSVTEWSAIFSGTTKSQSILSKCKEESEERDAPAIIIDRSVDWNNLAEDLIEKDFYYDVATVYDEIKVYVSNDNEHRRMTSYLLQKEVKFRTHLPRDELRQNPLPSHVIEVIKRKNKGKHAYKLYPTKSNRRKYRDLIEDANRAVSDYKFNQWDLFVRRQMSRPTKAHDHLTAPDNILDGFTCDPHELEHLIYRCFMASRKETREAINDHLSLVEAMQDFVGPLDWIGIKEGKKKSVQFVRLLLKILDFDSKYGKYAKYLLSTLNK